MKIIIPDLGQGNCVGIFGNSSLLIDCGTSDQNKQSNLNVVKSEISNSRMNDVIITHYHSDHYNLLSQFRDGFFENAFLPALPSGGATARVMLDFLALAIAVDYKQYYLSSLILSKAKEIRALVKNQKFTAHGRDWEVLWPDYKIIDSRNKRKISNIQNKIQDVKENLTPEQSERFEYFYKLLSTNFSGDEKEGHRLRQELSHNENSQEIGYRLRYVIMPQIELLFKELANRASLVVRDCYFEFLFTGDIDNTILDGGYLNFGQSPYFLIEASHHGRCYGSSFNSVTTQALVISRGLNTGKPDDRYFSELDWKVLVDTMRNGGCIIQCYEKPARKIYAHAYLHDGAYFDFII